LAHFAFRFSLVIRLFESHLIARFPDLFLASLGYFFWAKLFVTTGIAGGFLYTKKRPR
jgi:hypothetical protein